MRLLEGDRSAFVVRRGFTLVELLVVIAIVGILIAMLLPAVQAVREAARKTSCHNNMHQVGIALHSYHNVHRTLPTGCFEWRGFSSPASHRQYAWSAFLLPFIEEQSLHSRIDFDVAFDDPANAEAAATPVATYRCPSAIDRFSERGLTDYAGLFGERIVSRDIWTGVFLYDRPIPFKAIFDGLSNTMCVAEDVGGPNSEWINGLNVFVQSHGINDRTAWIGDNEIRSLHPSGAMVLFTDGHSQFLSDSTDRQVLGAMITRAGREILPADALE